MSEKFDSSLLKEAKKVLQGLGKIKPKFAGDLKVENLRKRIGELEGKVGEVVRLDKEHARAVNDRNRTGRVVSDLLTRLRSAVRGVYGPDSDEYELVGGTRRSERKRPGPKPKAPPPEPPA